MTHRRRHWAIITAAVLSLASSGIAAPAFAANKLPAAAAEPATPQTVDVQAGIAVTHAPGNYGRVSFFEFGAFALLPMSNFSWARIDVDPMFVVRRDMLESGTLDARYDPIKEGVWSPDSRRLAFFMHNAGVGNTTLRLLTVETYYRLKGATSEVLQPLDGGSPLVGKDPSWSPDGRYLIYSDADGDIAKVAISGVLSDTAVATPVKLYDSPTRVRNPRWSPDGTRIAFAEELAGEDNVHNLAMIDSDGANRVTLTSFTNGDDSQPAWSPDSASLVFSRWDRRCTTPVVGPARRYDLFLMTPQADSAITRLTFVAAQDQTNECNHSAQEAYWSPDGRELFFSTTNPDNTTWDPPGTGPFSLKFAIYRTVPIQRGAVRPVDAVSFASTRGSTQHFPQLRPLVLAGKDITFTLVARNRDESASATNLTVNGSLPEDVDYVSHVTPAGWTCSASLTLPTQISCSSPSLSAGAIVSIPVRATVRSNPELGHVITGSASITAGSGDSDLSNNTAEVVRQVVSPTPLLTTTLGTTAASCQPSTTYITVTYRTPVTYCYTPNANVTAPLIFKSGINQRYDASGTLLETKYWGPPDPFMIMMPKSPLVLIQTTSEEPPEERRHKSWWSSEIFDMAGSVTATTYTTEVVLFNADLSIGVTTTQRIAEPRSPITFTMVVSNTGPDDPVVNVINTLTGFTNIQVRASRGACTTTGIDLLSCKLGTMVVGSSAYLTITARTPGVSGNYASIGSVAGSGLQDIEPSDNIATAPVTIEGLDKQIFLPLMRRT